MKARSRNSIIVLLFIGLFLGAGGSNGLRRVRARWRAWLQPPTADQMQRALPDTAAALPAALPRERVRGKMWLANPPRPVSVAVLLASIIGGTLLTMYFTGRPRSPAEPR
jgi:hypothetical protein